MIYSNQPVFPVAEAICSVSVSRWLPNDKNFMMSCSDVLFWGWDVEWQWPVGRKSSFSSGSAGGRPQLSSSLGMFKPINIFLCCCFVLLIYFSTKERFQIESHWVCSLYLLSQQRQCRVSMSCQVRTFLYLPTNSWVVMAVFSTCKQPLAIKF